MTDKHHSTLNAMRLSGLGYRTRAAMDKNNIMIMQEGRARTEIVILTHEDAATLARAILKSVGEE